mgnify:CR=1 FL=1
MRLAVLVPWIVAPCLLWSQQAPLVGSPAPALKPARWVQGGPVKLEKGSVTVVEFWATWCGPCRDTIPHLTELAKRFQGRVQVVGVNIWEKPSGMEDVEKRVNAFVAELGPQMGYPVARDTTDGQVATAWMGARGQHGIPRAYVVDRDGRIAWAGHPLQGLDGVLEAVLAGTHDVAAEARREAAQARFEAALPERRRATRCEGQWVALPAEPGAPVPVAFVFVHPQAGFALRLGGALRVDEQGRFVAATGPDLPPVDTLMRLEADTVPPVRPLPPPALAALKLEPQPHWLKDYTDPSDELTRAQRRGWLLNHMGEPELARQELQAARLKHPKDPDLVFELAFAHNALEAFDASHALLKAAVEQHPTHRNLRMELGFVSMQLGRLAEAVGHYEGALALMPAEAMLVPEERQTKAEMLMNLASLHHRLGAPEKAKQLTEHAKRVAPEGSPIRSL